MHLTDLLSDVLPGQATCGLLCSSYLLTVQVKDLSLHHLFVVLHLPYTFCNKENQAADSASANFCLFFPAF